MSFFKKDNIKIFLVLSLILVAIVILFSISILNIQYKSYKSQMYNSLSAITSVLIAENPEKEVEIINAVKSINENDVENGKKILAKYGIGENSTIEVEQIGKIINQNKAINILIFVLGFSLLIVLFVVFLALRERKIKNITQYLKDLQNNIYSLKIEENTEGELSELQNQIVKITIMLNKQAETNCLYLQIIIKDEGEGISKEDLPNIFKRFYKGKDSSKESFGIGLALAKTIIEKQNGEIRVQSKIGEGTQFRIRLFRLLYNMKVVNLE